MKLYKIQFISCSAWCWAKSSGVVYTGLGCRWLIYVCICVCFCLYLYLSLYLYLLATLGHKGLIFMWRKCHLLREGVNGKKTFSFGHCPNPLNSPPPITPIRATWSSFFGSQNSRFEIQFWTKTTIYTIQYTVYMQPKKQLKVQYIGIFEEIDLFIGQKCTSWKRAKKFGHG